MSDDQQMMSSIEQHSKRSTTAQDLQVKSRKNRQIATNAKKLKKEQNQRCDVSNSNRNGNSNSIIKATAQTKSAVANTSAANQERSAGSVVITIRLLKMESSRNFGDASVVGNDEMQNVNYSNNHNNNNGFSSSGRPAQHEYSSNTSTTNNLSSHTYVNVQQENSNHNQNHSFSVDNNNLILNQCEFGAPTMRQSHCVAGGNGGVGGGGINSLTMNESSGNKGINSGQNERNSIKNQNVNCALRSEASICDKNQAIRTSQSEQPSLNAVNCHLVHPLNTITLTDKITAAATTTASSPPETKQPLSHTADTKPKPLQDTSSAFIPSNFIGSVSPYPHHIPIGNLIRPDYLNAVADERKS